MSVHPANNLFPVFLKLENLNVLLVGGGLIAHEKLTAILNNSPQTKVKLVAESISDEIKKLVIFSRDELKQFEMAENINSQKVRFFIGDVRDYQRLLQATDGIDVIVHAAAMKQIPAAEYNPMEAAVLYQRTVDLGENCVNQPE